MEQAGVSVSNGEWPAEVLLRKALAHHQLGQLPEAVACYQGVLAQQSGHFDALHLLGSALGQQGRFEEGLQLIDRALQLRADHALAHNNRGGLLLALGRAAEAVAAYDQGLRLQPADAVAHFRRGIALQSLGEAAQAVQAFDHAMQLQPGMTEARQAREALLAGAAQAVPATAPSSLASRGTVNDSQEQSRRARETLQQLEQIDGAPVAGSAEEQARAHMARAESWASVRMYQRASDAFAEAQRLAPQLPLLPGYVLYNRLRAADWHDLAHWRGVIEQGLARGQPAVPPLAWLPCHDDPESALRAARIYGERRYPGARAAVARPASGPAAPRIRLAYLSADFKEHPVTRVLAEVFELHDRQRFEVHGYSYGGHAPDDLSRRLSGAFDRFVDVRGWSDAQIADDLAARGIDVAIDLNGHTEHSRTSVLEQHPVPVTANYIGFPGTSGLPFMDYVIGDPILIPAGDERFYSEAVVRLPHCYLPADRRRPLLPAPPRSALGLPDEGFVFCAFSNTYKIAPEVFDAWMRLLLAVPGSVLWLVQDSDDAAARLRAHARERGIDGARLVMAERASYEQYLARYARADLFLDTFPYNALATASDALWAGLPVLTRTGHTYVSRGATSILKAAGLPELVTTTLHDYEATALRLARQPEELQALRARLAAQRDSCALFDTPAYVRQLEAALEGMVRRARAGQPPGGFDVGP